MTGITDVSNGFISGVIGGLQKVAGALEYVILIADPEHSYKDRDTIIINSTRKAYAAIFSGMPMPLEIRYQHESKTLQDKLDPTAVVPTTNIYSPPLLLPEKYSINEADVGQNNCRVECRSAILIIQDYINKLNKLVPGTYNPKRAMFNYGHKSDALRYIFSLIANAFFELSKLTLTDHSSLTMANKYISFLENLTHVKDFRDSCNDYSLCDKKLPLKVIDEAYELLLKVKEKIQYRLSNCSIAEQVELLYKKADGLVQETFNLSVFIMSTHQQAQVDTCILESSKIVLGKNDPALKSFRKKLAISLNQSNENNAMPLALLVQEILKIQPASSNKLSITSSNGSTITPFLSTDLEIDSWVELLLNDDKENGVYKPFKSKKPMNLVREYVVCCSNLLTLARLKRGLNNLCKSLRDGGDFIAVMKFKVAIEVHLDLVENQLNKLIASRDILLTFADQNLRTLSCDPNKPSGWGVWEKNYLTLNDLIPTETTRKASIVDAHSAIANIKGNLKSWSENPDAKMLEFIEHNYNYYHDLLDIARMAAKSNPSVAALLPALEREMGEMLKLHTGTMKQGTKPGKFEELDDDADDTHVNQQPRRLLQANVTGNKATTAVTTKMPPASSSKILEVRKDSITPNQPPVATIAIKLDSYPVSIDRKDLLKTVYSELIECAKYCSYLSNKDLSKITQKPVDIHRANQFFELLDLLVGSQTDNQVTKKLFYECLPLKGIYGSANGANVPGTIINRLFKTVCSISSTLDDPCKVIDAEEEGISLAFNINSEPPAVVLGHKKAAVDQMPTVKPISKKAAPTSSPVPSQGTSISPIKQAVIVEVDTDTEMEILSVIKSVQQESKQEETAEESQDRIDAKTKHLIKIKKWVDKFSDKPINDKNRKKFGEFWNEFTYLNDDNLLYWFFRWALPYTWNERESMLKYHAEFKRDNHHEQAAQQFLTAVKSNLMLEDSGLKSEKHAALIANQLMNRPGEKVESPVVFIEKKVTSIEGQQKKSEEALNSFISKFQLNVEEGQEQAWCAATYKALQEQLHLLNLNISDTHEFLTSSAKRILHADESDKEVNDAFDNYLSEVLDMLCSESNTDKANFLTTIARGLITLNANPLTWVTDNCNHGLNDSHLNVVWNVLAPQTALILSQLEHRSEHLGQSAVFFKDEVKNLIGATRTYGAYFSKDTSLDNRYDGSQVLLDALKFIDIILNEGICKTVSDDYSHIDLMELYTKTHQALVKRINENGKIKKAYSGETLLDKIIIVDAAIKQFALLKFVSHAMKAEEETKHRTQMQAAAEQRAEEERAQRLAAEQKALASEQKALASEQKAEEERTQRLVAEQKSAQQAAQIAALIAQLAAATGQQPPLHHASPIHVASAPDIDSQPSVQSTQGFSQ